MAQKIKITATDGSELIIEALGVLSQGDFEQEREALEEALAEATQTKNYYENALANITNIEMISAHIEYAKQDILAALPQEASEEEVDDIFSEDESEPVV